MFQTVIVTIDGSELALDAARLAVLIADPQARVVAVTVADAAQAADLSAGSSRKLSVAAATAALETAAASVLPPGAAAGSPVETTILHGFAPAVIGAAVQHETADLISVGMTRSSRAEGFFTGDLATELLHAAACSVLAGRPAGRRATGLVVVGVDGSPSSARALAAARHICRRLGARLRVVAATGGKPIDMEAARAMAGDDVVAVDSAGAVDALTAASSGADLLVVGSRGLHGLRSLGSVSERIAHAAPCSTLVYR